MEGTLVSQESLTAKVAKCKNDSITTLDEALI